MENWYPGFEKEIVAQLKEAERRDLRFFRIEEYLRNAERIDGFAGSCRDCNSFRMRMDQMKGDVARAVESPGKERCSLDDLQSKVNGHMRKAHGFSPPYYHTYMQSVYWTVGFMLAAFLLSYGFPEVDKVVFYSPAFVLGVLTGQVVGGRKDRKIRETHKNL